MTPSRFLPAIRPLLGAFFVLASLGALAQPLPVATITSSTPGVGGFFHSSGATIGIAGSGSGVVSLGNQVGVPAANDPGYAKAGNFGVSTAANQPRYNNAADLPVGNGKVARLNVGGGIDKPSVGRAFGRFASKAIFPLAVGVAAYDLLQELGYTGLQRDQNGVLIGNRQVPVRTFVSPTWCNSTPSFPGESEDAYLQRCIGPANYLAGSVNSCGADLGSHRNCLFRRNASSGQELINLYWHSTVNTPRSLTEADIADALGNKATFAPNSALPRAIRDLLADGQAIDTIGTPTVTGPASVPGPKTVTNNPDGTRTEKQQVTNLTYNGPNITITNVTTTTNYNAQNVPTGTTTETKTDEKPETDAPAADTDLPKQPELYKPKYPNGPAGVWDAEFAKIKATPLFSLPSQLAPNLGDSGGCPNWTIPLDVGIYNWGTHGTNIPCSVWTFLRLCIIVGALFLARALIFGG